MFIIVALFWIAITSVSSPVDAVMGPEKITTCEEFETEAYFNPYEIVDSSWKIFYFWGNTTELYPVIFSLPSKQRMSKIRAVIETAEPHIIIEWDRAVLLMDPRPGLTVVFLYAGNPGAFRALVKMEQRSQVQPHPLPLIKFADVRLKMMGPYIAMMCCEDLSAYALVRIDEMPTTEQACTKAAYRLGIRLPNGRSYLHVKRLADEL